MGKVFTPEELAAHHVPEPGAHEQAGRYILDQFFEVPGAEEQFRRIITGSGVVSGMVYGSTALGRAGIRSDVDVLLNYRADKPDILDEIRRVFTQAETMYRVPVEANVQEVGSMFEPLHHGFDPLFAEHLLEVQNQDNPRWSYNWPVDGLAFTLIDASDTERLRRIAVRYMGAKERKFTKAAVNFRGEVDYPTMQRALELPSALGRKVLAATHSDTAETPEAVDRVGMGEAALARLEACAPAWYTSAIDAQRSLLQMDRDYDALLDLVLTGDASLGDYTRWVEGNYLNVCKRAVEVSRAWCEIISHKMDMPRVERANQEDASYDLDEDVY